MIGKDSRYATSILFLAGGTETLGSRTPIATEPRPDDLFHTVVEGDRLDLLAERHLGRAELWWVLADFNEIRWPLKLETGSVLRSPSRQRLALG